MIFCLIWGCGNPVFMVGWLLGYGFGVLVIAMAVCLSHSTFSILGMVRGCLRFCWSWCPLMCSIDSFSGESILIVWRILLKMG